MTREKRRWRVTRATLMRGTVVDVHQLRCDEVRIDVGALEPGAQTPPRRERIEHRNSYERRIDDETRDVTARRRRVVAPHEAGGLDEHKRRILPGVAGTEDGGVRGGERGCDEGSRLADLLSREIVDETQVETRAVPRLRAIRHSESQQIEANDVVRLGERVDVRSPLVGPGGGVDPVQEQHRPALARTRLTMRVEESATAPLEPALIASDEILVRSDAA